MCDWFMSNIKVGDIVKGQITGITVYGVFVSLMDDYTGMVHISEVSNKFIRDLNSKFKIGDIINVKVMEIDENKSQVKLSIKQIDYNVEPTLSKIPENGQGFKLLEENLPVWTKEKMEELVAK